MNGHAPPRRLIVNADDFGASHGINAGILRAHTRGVVTSASLMVTMPGTEEAVSLARDHPSLSIGLHANLTGEGTPAPVALDDVERCRRELAAQLGRFHRLLDRPPTHLDAHHNVHRLPHLEGVFVAAATEWRIPLREHSPVRYFPDFYGQWDDTTHPEQVSTEKLLQMLDEEVGPGITELSCHPGIVDPALSSPYHRERELELATLCDPAVARHIARSGIELISYLDLVAVGGGGVP